MLVTNSAARQHDKKFQKVQNRAFIVSDSDVTNILRNRLCDLGASSRTALSRDGRPGLTHLADRPLHTLSKQIPSSITSVL